MAKKHTHHRSKSFTIPVAVVAGLAPAAVETAKGWSQGGFSGAGNAVSKMFAGYDLYAHQFNFGNLKYGLLPAVAGFAVHKLAGQFGINRAIAAAGIPVIRL